MDERGARTGGDIPTSFPHMTGAGHGTIRPEFWEKWC